MREQILPADIYLLCSDGLWSEITDDDLKISMLENDINIACEKLVGLALEAGAPDNITAIMFRIETIGKQATSSFSLQTILDRVPKFLNRNSER